ncbi:arylphorin subunit alpha [Culex quinquefasciatus]|uniref:Arylphorin subunit alpha n=1 Tax=Culex quinquefasciatus TaxID=7176 RepID=B0WKQ2_CULQU|nr:arylphorin subunit alpha [Culex quinquefasciatus]|eukprot:XP_001849286.1 arylphorin subunit alpha [Culex quinquefasciatus]
MRSFTVLALAATLAVASAAFMPNTSQVKYADKEWLHKQEDLLLLFRHVYQKDWNPQLVAYAKNFKLQGNFQLYNNVDAAKEFWAYYEHGLLPKGEVFSIYDEVHREQAIALFHMFYYAKDWDTFYKTAAWARYYVNEGMFVYALTVAVTHRPDMAGFVLPAPYEIYPYYFINTEVIQKAQQYKMQGYYNMKKVEGVYQSVITTNYTGWYLHSNPEQKITYFTEDIGLNTYYYYFHIDYPFWMGGKEFGLYKDRRGELYLYEHQQILARYYLERLSNDLGHIPEFSWYWPVKTGYYPDLQYYNGHSFPNRDNYYFVNREENYHDIQEVDDYERRIREVIDRGYLLMADGKKINFTVPEAVDYLGNLIQSNPDSYDSRFYKYLSMFSRILMGAAVEPVEPLQVIPSVLEHYESAMRDPAFYQIYKRIIHYYYQFKDHLPSYSYDELYFPGVKVEDVSIDKLVTYFDRFDVDVTNAIDVEPEAYVEGKYDGFGEIEYKPDPVLIKARTIRLNHKPFTYKMTVASEKAVKSVIRVFIGPKFDEFGSQYLLNENRENFYELDYFLYDLVPGKNVITRNSLSFNGYVKDRTSFYELYKKVMLGYTTDVKFPLDNTEAHCGFPNRLMLPKGKKGGMPFQFFFMVSPYTAPEVQQYTGFDPVLSCGVGSGARYFDKLPFGYPFDRKIDETYFYVPNMFFEDAIIFHKKEGDINTVV